MIKDDNDVGNSGAVTEITLFHCFEGDLMLFLPLLRTLYHLSLSVQSKFKLKQNGQVVRVLQCQERGSPLGIRQGSWVGRYYYWVVLDTESSSL